MNELQKQDFVRRMGKRKGFSKGGPVRKNYTLGGAIGSAGSGAASGAALGSVVPGIGTAIGAVAGGIGGLISGLFSGGGPEMPNIVDPVTGYQITNANGQVVASQQQLQDFATSLQGPNGVQIQQSVAQQLQGVANGTCPNPALAAFHQATGANVAQQAALQAGQRGAASNVGLIARQAGQQGAAIQQGAAGQLSTLQSEQQLNALNAESGVAAQIVGEQQGALNSASAAAGANQGNLLGAQSNYNTALTGGQGNVNTTNASLTNAALPVGVDLGKGAIAAAGFSQATSGGGSGGGGNAGTNGSSGVGSTVSPYARGGKVIEGPHDSHVANYLAMSKGGKVPAQVSPGELYLSPDKVQKVLEGANPLEVGDKIPGKAKVKGDSRKNDTVPRTLEEGGVVVPRSHVMSEEKAALFVHRAMAKKGRR